MTKKYSDEKNRKIEDLNKHLEKINNKDSKIAIKIQALIDYYGGSKNAYNSYKNDISSRTIERIVNQYEKNDFFCYKNKLRLSEYEREIVLQNIEINPLKIGLNCSIWNEDLLKYYIKNKFKVNVDKAFCRRILHKSNTTYKSKNYNIKKNKKLINEVKNMIEMYESKKGYKIWYFDICYLGKIFFGKVSWPFEYINGKKYEEYYGYLFYTENPTYDYMLDIKNIRKFDSKVFEEIQKIMENDFKFNTYIIILNSDNNFKPSIKEINNYDIKLIFLPKGSLDNNEVSKIYNKVKKDNSYNEILEKWNDKDKMIDEFEKMIKKYTT
ncbi:hypothetical protein AB8U03_17375 [Clostridium sp. Mt-5]|uniref:Uncharacterized protein n=1 Tax=Clostridium moutaii TaxID=3240932 RepID=A0ABV4BT31_9CLOT